MKLKTKLIIVRILAVEVLRSGYVGDPELIEQELDRFTDGATRSSLKEGVTVRLEDLMEDPPPEDMDAGPFLRAAIEKARLQNCDEIMFTL